MSGVPRIAVGGILHESNTFSPRLTGLDAFARGATRRDGEIEAEFGDAAHEVGGFLVGGREHGLRLVPTLVANAVPSGTVSDDAFEALTGELIARLRAAGRIDGVLLALHGAMVTQSYPDADAEILRRLRRALGADVPVVATHDAHANVAVEEVDLCSALVIYKEVPHVDQRDRGRQAAAIMARIVGEGLRPAQAIAKPPLLYNILFHDTTRPPMLPLVNELKRLEREDSRILAASAAVGYQYADVPQMGPSVVVVTDGDRGLAREEARRLAGLMRDHRHQMRIELPDAAEAVRRAIGTDRLLAVLVDLGDNIGGGSAGDGTALLAELLRQGASGFAVPIYDPGAVKQAFLGGVGSPFDGEVGGKSDDLHGDPVRVRARVKLLYDGKYTETAARHGGMRYLDQGATAVLEVSGATGQDPGFVLINSERHPPFSLGQLTSAGIHPEQLRVIVVKAAVAFRAAYEPIAGTIIPVDTQGLTAVDPRRFAYRRAKPDLLWTGPAIRGQDSVSAREPPDTPPGPDGSPAA